MDSFDELRYGDEIEYVGPAAVQDGYSTPRDYALPWTFCHTFSGGGFRALTKFNGPKIIAVEHPINDPSHWGKS